VLASELRSGSLLPSHLVVYERGLTLTDRPRGRPHRLSTPPRAAARVPDVRADNPALRPGRVGDGCPKPTWDTSTGAGGAGRTSDTPHRRIVEWLTPRHLSPHAHPSNRPSTYRRPTRFIDAPHGERVEGGCAEWAPKLLGLPPERRRLRSSLRCVDSDHAALTGRCAAEYAFKALKRAAFSADPDSVALLGRLACPPDRSRLLRAACRPCSRGPARGRGGRRDGRLRLPQAPRTLGVHPRARPVVGQSLRRPRDRPRPAATRWPAASLDTTATRSVARTREWRK
jgi:hypothetical protein